MKLVDLEKRAHRLDAREEPLPSLADVHRIPGDELIVDGLLEDLPEQLECLRAGAADAHMCGRADRSRPGHWSPASGGGANSVGLLAQLVAEAVDEHDVDLTQLVAPKNRRK